MNDYKDYGFYTTAASHILSYIGKPLLEMLDPASNRCIMDMGCGNGSLVEFLLQNKYDGYGVDASESGIAIAAGNHPDRFALMDFSDPILPEMFKNKRFDTLVSTEVIEHLYNPRGFIQLCRTLLPAKGELILSTPYHGYLKNLLIAVAGKWDSHMDPLWDGGHIKLWTERKITRLLEDEGFDVVKIVGCGRYPGLWKSMLVKAVLRDA